MSAPDQLVNQCNPLQLISFCIGFVLLLTFGDQDVSYYPPQCLSGLRRNHVL